MFQWKHFLSWRKFTKGNKMETKQFHLTEEDLAEITG
jgi:hypothetical protein